MAGGQTSIVVTGGTGFTGPFVVRELRRRLPDARIRCIVRPTSDRQPLTGLDVEFSSADLRDHDSLVGAFRGSDVLVNVASLGFDWVDPLFAAIRASSLQRGIFVSTTAILTKLPVKSRPVRERGERLARESGLSWTILRPTMIYGTAGDRNISRLIRVVERCPVIPIVAPDALQQPIHVEDVAAAIVSCVTAEATGQRTYNISGLAPLTLEDLVRETARAVGRPRAVVRLPFAPMVGAVRAYNRLSSAPRVSVEQLLRLREDKAFDHAAAAADFGFSPRSFRDGVTQEVKLMRNGRRS